MSAPELDERKHRDSLIALIGRTTDQLPIYEYGMVPGDQNQPDETLRDATPPPIYAVLALERRYTGSLNRMSGRPSRSGWRASFRTVGRTPNEARWARLQISMALDGVRVTVGAEISTPIEFESDTEIGPDNGKLSGSTVWTYAL